MAETKKPLFRDITAEDDDPEITEIESLCVNCEEQGVTRLFLTRIPFFQEVIVSSFNCDHCNYKNAELQPGAKIQDYGVSYTVKIKTPNDLNRQVVQSSYATVKIPELEFEVPPNKGVLTTVEGIIDRAVTGLLQDQVLRKIQHPEAAAKIEEFTKKLEKLKELDEPFTLIVEDPTGNSFVENLHVPNKDPDMKINRYKRSAAQNEELGMMEGSDVDGPNTETVEKDEIIQLPSNCPNCNSPCTINMKMVDIPNFKEVVIMACNCDACGYRDNEVKGASGMQEKGVRITLHITDKSDLSRDLLKTETSSISIPELELESQMGTLGGKFTTVEGILINIRDQLGANPFMVGDSSTGNKVKKFCDDVDEIIQGNRLNVHLILDDPAGNSYLQNVYAPEDDPEMKVEHYERTFEQNEELGLNDMKTENYD
ncbi:zinc finger protein ZPR1 [Patella vulgata]|uniref:zinc finger protein ZPR1 n=1 Tax=Patella vulgata TaxID=6465 RepID=UPI00217F7ADB|nr:zinc finger protein ZPR1 [Patella vulgata]